ncbi:hypothetical protein Tco_0594965 [Tanacetum coccineum]
MRVLQAEEQLLPAVASPTADSPGYVPESDSEEDDEDPEEDLADYPADRDDDDEEEEEEPFGDDVEDEDEEEEEEHPALADSVPPVHRMTARISIRDEPSISLPLREDVERLLALTTPLPSPLTPLSSPLPHIPSPPFPASPPASPIRPLGYRAAMIRLRAETPSTSHPLPLPTSSPLLQLLSFDHRTDRPEITLPPQKRLGIDLGPRRWRAEVGRYDNMGLLVLWIRDVWIDPREAVEEAVIDETQTKERTRQTYIYSEAWGHSIEVSYMTRSEILALRSVVMGQQAVILQLQAADRLETQMAEFQRQLGPEKGLAQPNAPGEAGSSS